MLDLICNLFIAEQVEKWIENSDEFKEQSIFDKDCYVIKDGNLSQGFVFTTYAELVAQYVQ